MGLGRSLLFRVATSKRLERAVKRVPGGEHAAWRSASRYFASRSLEGALGKPPTEAQEGDVGRLPVWVRAGRLNVGTFDEPDMDTGAGQGVGVVRRAHEIRLHGDSEPVGKAACGDGEDAVLDRIGESGLFGTHLHAPAARQGVRDGREAIGRGRRVSAQREM